MNIPGGLIGQGQLTPRKSGRRTLFLVSDLERLVEGLPAGTPRAMSLASSKD